MNFVNNKLHIRHALDKKGNLNPPKSGKPRTIDLTPAAREALLELRIDSAEGFVFKNGSGGERRITDIQKAFGKARTYAALAVTDDGVVCLHSLRHTGISRLANHPQIPLVYVKSFAGHSDLG